MGHGYKGDTGHYRSFGENADILKSTYQYSETTGYFGIIGKSGNSKVRNITSVDPIATAQDFYSKGTYGGIEKNLGKGKGFVTHMRDGSILTYREVSSSDGSPAININISSKSAESCGVKTQKIHFIKK